MTADQLKPKKTLRGPIFPEPVEVIVTVPMGDAVKLFGRGVQTGRAIDIILTPDKLALLQTSPDVEPFDGDAHRFRLGIEAMRLQLSAHARREKSIRHGHISTLHIWWARRPLAACRAVICGPI